MNEFLARPFTIKSIQQRMQAIIESPRAFVRSKTYFGPDRRRHNDVRYKGPERRVRPEDLVEI